MSKSSLALILFFTSLCLGSAAWAQNSTATLTGTVKDEKDKQPLIGVNLVIRGTTLGSATDFDGKFTIRNIVPGEYIVEASYIGYEKKIFTGIKFTAGENKDLSFTLKSSMLTIGQDIVIIGEKPLVDVEDGKSNKTISKEVIDATPVKNIQGILNNQTGIVQNSEGIHIRGGRTYETGFYVDGVSAQDPLAGTGFGLDLGTNAIDNVEVTTGGSGVEYGDATAGVVNAETRSGKDKFELNFTHKRDIFPFTQKWKSQWNQTSYELNFGGGVGKKEKKKFHYFTSLKSLTTDDYFRTPARQVISSLYPSDTNFTAKQDNRYAAMLKLNYDFSPKKKLSFTYLKSLNINQDLNMLRVTGNDVAFAPGYQFGFSQQPDNANTFTHDTNMETLQWFQTLNKQTSIKIMFSRLFVHLRADANGREWRPQTVNSEFDPRSIVEYPATYFNPNDSIVFVNPASGFYNNGGIATLWHDHYVEEYTLKSTGFVYSKNTFNKLSFGEEIKIQELQWVDIYRPWIGAPIQTSGTQTTQSFRLGDISDVWHVYPFKASLFGSDHFKYHGLIADAGLRLEGWMPGAFVDKAIADSSAPVKDEIRASYLQHTLALGNRRLKTRMLPKLSASFPIKENQVMFFNYGHSTVAPHPSYLYQGLDPYYADRSTLSKLGNPDLNPEVDISYELGLKSQITSNDALNVVAYWKDKYDFITTASVLVKDVTGREVSRTIHINSDYARIRGLEVAYIKRVGKWFEGQASAAYSIATGQSSSSSESLKSILNNGNSETAKETPLAWDSPWDIKCYGLFTKNAKTGMFGKKFLNHMSAYVEGSYRSGRRYTPYIYTGNDAVTGKPLWEVDPDPNHRFQKLSPGNFLFSLNAKKWWQFKHTQLAITLEITNLLNNKANLIINPVTGRAYQYGDDVPTDWKDPRYIDPRVLSGSQLSPINPARYSEPRHFLIGAQVRF